MPDIAELRRKAEQCARLSRGISDERTYLLLSSLAEELTREADRLEAISAGEVVLFRGESTPSLRAPSHTSIA